MANDRNELIVSVSGIRGIVGASLTPEIATAYAAALGATLDRRPVVVSRDSRPTGEMLQHAVAAGLLSVGCDVYRLGIAPTPTVGIAIRHLGAAGGVQITASHNAAPYNGLKLFGPRGMVLNASEGAKILGLHKTGNFVRAEWSAIGISRPLTADPFRHHVTRILEHTNVPAVRAEKFRVLLDANHGAGGPLGLRLLGELGCEVVQEGCGPDGAFAHDPEPTAANLAGVAPKVAEAKCALGFALDPDADRLALIDETGRYIGEELTLALAASFRMQQAKGPVVANMSTSRIMDDLAAQHGCVLHRSAVGEANVVEKMLTVDALLGGEGNGGVIDPRVGFVRDAFAGMAMILNLLAQSRKTLSTLVSELPDYAIVKAQCPVPREALGALQDQLLARWPEAAVNRLDGLRLDWSDRWLHVRPSNTEPIVRVIAEARQPSDAKSLCDAVQHMAQAL
jgi:phosphomannomutase